MEESKDESLEEILDKFQSKEEAEETKKDPRAENEISDNYVNFPVNIEANKKIHPIENSINISKFITDYETKENIIIKRFMFFFFCSVIDMLNQIIEKYKYDEKLFYPNINLLLKEMTTYTIKFRKISEIITLKCPQNMDIIFHVLEIEKKEGKTIFKTLINFRFEELYKYFITDDTVIIKENYIYDLREIFKTLSDVLKENREFEKNVEKFKNLEKQEMDTISLENDFDMLVEKNINS